VQITADSPCDLPDGLARSNGVTLIPLYLRFEGEYLRDGVEIDGRGVIKRYESTGKLPKTAAPSVGDYLSVWKPLLNDAGEVIHISLSSGISSAYQTARIAAAECGRVRVIDSKQLCGAFSLEVLHACELRSRGLNAAEIAAGTREYIQNLYCAFLVEDVNFLRAGGRCSALEAIGAELLRIRPSLTMLDGKIVPLEKYRGDIHAARRRFINDALARCTGSGRAVLVHTCLPEEDFRPLAQMLEDTGRFREVITFGTGGVISAHCGRGTVGIFFPGIARRKVNDA